MDKLLSMYEQYINERANDFLVHSEDGFATYRFLDDDRVYIVDIFVKPEKRLSGVASALADIIVEQALKAGKKELIGTVVPSANGSTESLRVLLGYKMKLKSASNDLIVFGKDI